MCTYTVKQLNALTTNENIFDFDWSIAEEGKINQHLWPENDYEPETRFYLMYGKNNLFGLILTRGDEEFEPRAEVTEFQGPVANDSCLEFFMAYEPENLNYINLETNYNATVHLGLGKDRHNRLKLPKEDLEGLELYSFKPEEAKLKGIDFAYEWGIAFKLPAKMLYHIWSKYANASEALDERFFSGQEVRANLFKCGDKTNYPHYFAWNEIPTKEVNFHQPEYFGKLIFE